jgi:hypothetical protein
MCHVAPGRLRWILPLLASVVLSGCFSLDSAVFLNRGYTDEDLVREEALEGRWARADEVDERPITAEPPGPALVIERGDASEGCYKVSFFERFVEDWLIARPETSAKLCAFRVSGQTFLDITRWPEGIDFESMTVTWHWFAAADVSSDELRLRMLHPFLVGEYLRKHPLDLQHTKLDYGGDAQIVVTAPPRDIQLFLLLHLGLNDLMDEEYVLRKLPPAEPAEDSGAEAAAGESGAQVAPQER